MYINTGYLNHSHKDFKDKSRPLIVGSCGTYRLSQHPKMPTYRPRGRLDYQIIYISSGLVHFHFDNPENETIIPAGHIVLFRPKELQKYEFAKGGGKYVVVYWWWNHNLCVRYVYLLKAGLNMEINRRMEILSCRWTIWVLFESHKNRWCFICPIWNYYDYASGYFGVINSSLWW